MTDVRRDTTAFSSLPATDVDEDFTHSYEHSPHGFNDNPLDCVSSPRFRWQLTRPASIAICTVLIVISIIIVWTQLNESDAPGPHPVIDFAATGQESSTSPSAEPVMRGTGENAAHLESGPATIVVSVVGAVHIPGLVTLPRRSRVADAIAAAGGARDPQDMASLNLAQMLSDGDQISLGVNDSGQGGNPGNHIHSNDRRTHLPSGQSQGTAQRETSGLINLNTATQPELLTLPGVGPVTATAIVQWRNAHGKFNSVDQLDEVDGIGPARVAKLRDKVTV